MKGPGMMVALLNEKKGKAEPEPEEAPPSSRSGSEMEDDDRAEALAGEVFDALQEEDREAFSQALLSLIYHCC